MRERKLRRYGKERNVGHTSVNNGEEIFVRSRAEEKENEKKGTKRKRRRNE
jgi:hypothetical protein